MKTSNEFIARQCDQADEVTELGACIASGQVSAAQVDAHRVAGDFVKPAHLNVCPRHDGDMVTDPAKGCPRCNSERAQPVQLASSGAVELTDSETKNVYRDFLNHGGVQVALNHAVRTLVEIRNSASSPRIEAATNIAQPVQPADEQPVAWLAKRGFLIPGDVISTCQYDRKEAWQKKYYEPLYAIARPVQPAPVHWVGMSDHERDQLCKHWNDNALQLCMDVQAVLKFKNAAPQGTPAQSAPQLDQLEPHLTGRWQHGSTS